MNDLPELVAPPEQPVRSRTRGLVAWGGSALLHGLTLSAAVLVTVSSALELPHVAGREQVVSLEASYSAPEPAPDLPATSEVDVMRPRVEVSLDRARVDSTEFVRMEPRHVSATIEGEQLAVDFDPAEQLPQPSPARLPQRSQPPTPEVTPAISPPSRSAAVPPAIASRAAEPSELGQAATTLPRATHSPPPTYPPQAWLQRLEGAIRLRVSIAADGTVDRVEVADTSGHPILDGAAASAVSRWRFAPARRGATAVPLTVSLTVRFVRD